MTGSTPASIALVLSGKVCRVLKHDPALGREWFEQRVKFLDGTSEDRRSPFFPFTPGPPRTWMGFTVTIYPQKSSPARLALDTAKIGTLTEPSENHQQDTKTHHDL